MFSFNWLQTILQRIGGGRGGGVRLKLDVQGQGGGWILDVDGQGGGGLENWIIFMDVKCLSSLISLKITAKFHVM